MKYFEVKTEEELAKQMVVPLTQSITFTAIEIAFIKEISKDERHFISIMYKEKPVQGYEFTPEFARDIESYSEFNMRDLIKKLFDFGLINSSYTNDLPINPDNWNPILPICSLHTK